jgi:hypothetical protein
MDYALEQLINGPAGSRPVLDVVMTIVAGGADVIFMALVAGWFLCAEPAAELPAELRKPWHRRSGLPSPIERQRIRIPAA